MALFDILHSGMLWIYEVPKAGDLCQGFYIGANSFFFTLIFYINNVRAYIIIFEINKFFILKLFNSKLKFIIS